MEGMLYELSDGDLVKAAGLRKQNIEDVYSYLYLKRVNGLNMLLEKIARLKELKNE
jgi:hypothetical protein